MLSSAAAGAQLDADEREDGRLFTWRRGAKAPDHTPAAEALFRRFAERHGLRWTVLEAPVEVLWEFPAQPGLAHAIVLGLQNDDELNFGVGFFWSCFFPFEAQAAGFEATLDAWMRGDARVVRRRWDDVLELREDGGWRRIYSAGHWRSRSTGKLISNLAD
jgi:hypothetical protein